MNVLLTDILACPRCGGDFGLILFAADTVDRRVREGELGCPNCRDEFPIREGFADLRSQPRGPLMVDLHDPLPERGPLAIAAGMGIAEGPGAVLLIGAAAEGAGEVARLVSGIEVIAVSAASRSWRAESGVSRVVAWPGLPVRTGRVRGAALDRQVWPTWRDELKRVLVPAGRVVVLGSDPEDPPGTEDPDWRVLLAEGDVSVLGRG